MPYISKEPKRMGNIVVTEFVDSVGTSEIAYYIPGDIIQNSLSINNIGPIDLIVTVGTQVNVRIPAYQGITLKENYTFFSIKSTSGVCGFRATCTTQDIVDNSGLSAKVNDLSSQLAQTSNLSKVENGAVIKSDPNGSWSGWSGPRMNFGLPTNTTPIPAIVESPLISKGTIIAGGTNTNLLRWGFHVFEGYAADNRSRITMLVNKHIEEGRSLAELYYYLTAYNHSNAAYGWFKLGSDVKQHSFMFSRDKAIAFGEWDLRNVMTLARISPTNDLNSTYQTIAEADAAFEAEDNAANNAKCVLYLALKNAQNGAMFYDTDRNSVVIKKNGVWCDMNVTPVPDGTYSFAVAPKEIMQSSYKKQMVTLDTTDGAKLSLNSQQAATTYSAVIPISNNKDYSVSITGAHDRFRVGTMVTLPDLSINQSGYQPVDIEITRNDSLNAVSFSNTTSNWLIIYYTATGQTPTISVLES